MAMDFLSRSYEYKKRSHSLEWLLSVLALPIFPGRLQPSIVGRSELNFRVRDGNGWTLALISTNYRSQPHMQQRPIQFGEKVVTRTGFEPMLKA